MAQDGNVRRTAGNGDKGTYGVGRLSICAVILLLATGPILTILTPHATATDAGERSTSRVFTKPMVMVGAAHKVLIAASSLNAISWGEMVYTSTCYASHPRRFRIHDGGATVGSTTLHLEGPPVYGRLAGLGSVALIKYNCFQPGTDEHISHEHIFVFAIQNGHVLQVADIPLTWSPRPRAMFGVDEYQTTGGVLIVSGHDATQLINRSGPVIMRFTYVWNGRALVQTTIRPTPSNPERGPQTGARAPLAPIKTIVTGIQPNVGDELNNDGSHSLFPDAGVAFDAAHSRLFVAGSMHNTDAGYAVVDTARGRLVRTGTVQAQVISLGVDSVRERGYLLLEGAPGTAGFTILSVDLSNGRVLWDIYFQSYDLSTTLIYLKAPAVIDPTTGNVFFEVLSGNATGFLRVSPSGADLGWQALEDDIFYTTSQFWMDGPHHRFVVLESNYVDKAILKFFDTRPHHPSFTRDIPYKPVTMAVDPRHGRLWALAPGNDVVIYDTTTGAMRAQIGRGNSYLVRIAKENNEQQTLVLDTKRGIGFIGCAKGCGIEQLQPGHSVLVPLWKAKRGDPFLIFNPGSGRPIAAGDGLLLVNVFHSNPNSGQLEDGLAVYPDDGGEVFAWSAQPNEGQNVSPVAADVGHPTTVIWSGNATVHSGLTGDANVPAVYMVRVP